MSYPVYVYIYDLTRGMARQMGPMVGLHDLEGVWHTAIVVHNTEFFFGGGGIEQCAPGTTMLGEPLEKKLLGHTNMDVHTTYVRLASMGENEFRGDRYDLFQHNCNNFSSKFALALGVNNIPQHILDLPQKVLNSPIAAMLRPILEQATPHGMGMTEPGVDNLLSSPSSSSSSSSSRPKNPHFPPKEMSLFNAPVDVDKVMDKLFTFNEKNCSQRIDDNELTEIRLACEPEGDFSVELWTKGLKPALEHWPLEDTFPLLHICCICCTREPQSAKVMEELYKIIKTRHMLSAEKSIESCIRMSLRILANCFATKSGLKFMMDHREEMIGNINTTIEELAFNEAPISPQVEIAVSSVVCNYAKALNDDKPEDSEEAAFQIVSALATTFLEYLKGPEALYKTCVALGTLIKTALDVKDLAQALEAGSKLSKIPKGRMERLDSCVQLCKEALTS